ncbi:MAG: hypothetical protein Q4E35_01550 [Eubacteriales bacterium]|nr:hypothetical protein [Eubacteriales bacterium]
MNDLNLGWGRSSIGDVFENWPKDENGQPEEPAFLCNCINNDMSDTIKINMLRAYGIPCVTEYPGDGGFGKLVLGMSGPGTDIYVPKSLLEDAKHLCEEEYNEEL